MHYSILNLAHLGLSLFKLKIPFQEMLKVLDVSNNIPFCEEVQIPYVEGGKE